MKQSKLIVATLIAWYMACILVALGFWGVIIWAAVHFIRKVW